jgi:hypothetical protein
MKKSSQSVEISIFFRKFKEGEQFVLGEQAIPILFFVLGLESFSQEYGTA